MLIYVMNWPILELMKLIKEIKMKKIVSVLMVLTIFSTSFSSTVYAEETTKIPDSTFSTIPDDDDLALIEKENQNGKAWIIDKNGNKKQVTKRSFGTISPLYTEGRLVYTFVRYIQNVTKSNEYQHFVSSVSIYNDTTKPITLKYTQQSTKSNEWSVTGKVEVEAEFKVSVLAKLKSTFGSSVTSACKTASSSSVEFTIEVPVKKTGKISKYYAGKYTGGQGVWSVQDVIGGYDPYTYYEDAGAWGIAKNEVNYKAKTY